MVQSTLDQVRAHRPNDLIVIRSEVFEQDPSYWISNGVFPLIRVLARKERLYFAVL